MGKLEQLLAASTIALGLQVGQARGEEPVHVSTNATGNEVVACLTEVDTAIYKEVSQDSSLAGFQIEIRGKEKLYGQRLRVQRPGGFQRSVANPDAGVDPYVDFIIKCDDGKFAVNIEDDNFIAYFSASSPKEIANKVKDYMDNVSTLDGNQAFAAISYWLEREMKH